MIKIFMNITENPTPELATNIEQLAFFKFFEYLHEKACRILLVLYNVCGHIIIDIYIYVSYLCTILNCFVWNTCFIVVAKKILFHA